jgi:hypothetical protein
MTLSGEAGHRDCEEVVTKAQLWRVDDFPLVMEDGAGNVLFRYGPPLLQTTQSNKCATREDHGQ